MKKFFLFALIALCFSSWVKNKRSFTPPGTVQITETLFADKREVTNMDWLEYEMWTKNKYGQDSKEYMATLPDSTVWNDKELFESSFGHMYFSHPAFRDYPVVGVSHEQALAYCKWRSNCVKQLLSMRGKKTVDLIYRLPCKEEWEALSMNGSEVFNRKNEYKLVKKTKNQTIYNVNVHANCLFHDTLKRYANIQPVSLYSKNTFGLYDMIGNVSEMVAEKGISKGGSFLNNLEECRVGKDQLYSKPQGWLGFRCVCDVR